MNLIACLSVCIMRPQRSREPCKKVLRGLNWKFVLVYLDDLIIFSNTLSEHLQHVKQVFNRIRESGLKLKSKKMYILSKESKILGACSE